MQLHYKKERLVCCACADCPSWSDFLEDLEIPEEKRCDNLGQPVSGQGGTPGLPTIVPPPPTTPPNGGSGGGGGGGVCDEEWNYAGKSIYYGGLLFGTPTTYTFAGNLKSQGAATISGGGTLLAIDESKTHLAAAVTLNSAALRVTEATGTTVCDLYLEALVDNMPTGFRIGPVRNTGDIATATGKLPIAAEQTLQWFGFFYDTDGNIVNTPLGGLTTSNFTKSFKVVIEYSNDDGVHPMLMDQLHVLGSHPELDRVFYSMPLDSNILTGKPAIQDITDVDRLTPGVGFFTPTNLSKGIAVQHYARNMTPTSMYYQLMDGTPISDLVSFTGAVGGLSDPTPPLPYTLQGPTDFNINHALETLSLGNIDTSGRFQLFNHIGPPNSFLGGASYEQDYSVSYSFSDHPRAQALVSGVMRSTFIVSGGSVLRASLNSIENFTGLTTNQTAARAATYLYIKSKFHHFSFWSMYEPVQAPVRCRLIIDNQTLFEMNLLAGDRLTQYADMFICIDGQLGWWEFTVMSGSTRVNLAVTCLYGPEGV